MTANERPADDVAIAYDLGAKMSRSGDWTTAEYADYCRLFPDSLTAREERRVHGTARIGSAATERPADGVRLALRHAKHEALSARDQYERTAERWRFWNGIVQAMSAALSAASEPEPGDG